MVKVGVIGCGYWGPNLIRNFSMDINFSYRGIALNLESWEKEITKRKAFK